MMSTLDMLRELGHEGIAARCGAAAIAIHEEAAQAAPIDALLTDINLPDMDGQLLAAEIRRRHPGLPVVFATGYRLTLAEALVGSGPVAAVNKPYRTSDLSEALQKVLATR